MASCKSLVYSAASESFAIDVYRWHYSIPKRRGTRSHNTLDSHFYEGLHLIIVLFLLLVLGFLVVVDHLALIELHTNNVVVTTVGVTIAPVTEATAFWIYLSLTY